MKVCSLQIIFFVCVIVDSRHPYIYLVYVTEMKPQNPRLVEYVFVFYLNFSHEAWKANVGVIYFLFDVSFSG
jgi:hypothetical protein